MKSVHSQKELPPSKIKISSQTPQHTTHLTLTHRTLTLPSFTMQARCSAHWNNQTLTDQKKKKTQTVDIRFKNEASKTFFPLLLCVLPSRPADPHSPNKNMHTHTKMRETRSRSSTNVDPQKMLTLFPPSTKLKRRAKREPEASRLQPLTPT